MVNYYHQFIPHCSSKLSSLTEIIKNKKKLEKLKWTEETIISFENIKNDLTQSTQLYYYDTSEEITLTTDASNFAIGAVLNKTINNSQKPISFFSKKLKIHQTHYSTFDRELLAIYEAIKHFEYLLEAKEFIILTDHKPLINAINMKTPSPRQIRQLSYISQFNWKIEYIPGNNNIVADALSRLNEDINQINFENILTNKELFTNQQDIIEQLPKQHSLKLKKINNIWYEFSINNNPRPIIPKQLQTKFIETDRKSVV